MTTSELDRLGYIKTKSKLYVNIYTLTYTCRLMPDKSIDVYKDGVLFGNVKTVEDYLKLVV